jgi:uncharacterized protein YukE
MSADVISVDFAALDAASATLKDTASKFDAEQQEMVTGLKPLADIWVASGSSAGQAYQMSTNKINEYEAHMITLINEFGRRVMQARENQMAIEASNASLFG